MLKLIPPIPEVLEIFRDSGGSAFKIFLLKFFKPYTKALAAKPTGSAHSEASFCIPALLSLPSSFSDKRL